MRSIIVMVAGAALLVWLSGIYLMSAPVVRISGSHAAVDTGWWHHTNFDVKPRQEVDGSVINYNYNSFGIGGGFIRAVGARADLSLMKTSDYSALTATNGGEFLASQLTEMEDQGKIRHLMLIPENEAVMNLLKAIPLNEGSRFHLAGHALTFEDADDPANIPGVEWFLVQTFRKTEAGLGALPPGIQPNRDRR